PTIQTPHKIPHWAGWPAGRPSRSRPRRNASESEQSKESYRVHDLDEPTPRDEETLAALKDEEASMLLEAYVRAFFRSFAPVYPRKVNEHLPILLHTRHPTLKECWRHHNDNIQQRKKNTHFSLANAFAAEAAAAAGGSQPPFVQTSTKSNRGRAPHTALSV
ncbi:unnamed protein product, partial [Ectocarpus sp. 12 AP-2014]